MLSLHVSELSSAIPQLHAGDRVLLSGVVYSARDAAHKRIVSALDASSPLPFELKGAVIYYTGPTPAKPGAVIGSCGPTTSSRMDVFAPRLYDLGLTATIGKGPRSPAVVDAIIRNSGIYFCAVGGAGALYASSVASLEVIAYPDLGCESVKKLELSEFPLYVGIDSTGHSLFSH